MGFVMLHDAKEFAKSTHAFIRASYELELTHRTETKQAKEDNFCIK